MLKEQEQRILGYFIDEAKDHFNTIEQVLLNLQTAIQDPETMNEVFRAAHSVKGGAAMLGYYSIQQTAHHLEDYFKVIKEYPTIQVDQKLESLFLEVFDTLKELLEQLEDSFCLTEDVVNNQMSKVEPVFAALNQHLKLLINQSRGKEDAYSCLLPVFQNQVLQQLRKMLQLFKQSETPETRQQLQVCCHQLLAMGKQFNLQDWCTLCETASSAITNQENTYRTLAPIVIKELKKSQELVIAARGAEIKISQQLQALSRNFHG